MASFITLKKTPIKEIIFTISFKENVELEKLENFKSLPKITETFPICNKGFNAQVEAISDQEAPTTKVSSDGFILKDKSPHSYLIQARRGSFSFHKVNGYESFEDLIIQLKTYWDLFIEVSGQLTVVNLSVRYLNFIEQSKDEKINDLITINTTHPFGAIKTNFTQHQFRYDKNPDIVVNVVTAIGQDGEKNGIVLDIILNKRIEINKELTFDFTSFNDMRTVKNEMFFKSITEHTIKKYNQ